MTRYVKHNYQDGSKTSPNLQQFEFSFHNSLRAPLVLSIFEAFDLFLMRADQKIWLILTEKCGPFTYLPSIHLSLRIVWPNLRRITYFQGNFFHYVYQTIECCTHIVVFRRVVRYCCL